MTAGTTMTGLGGPAPVTLARSWPALALRGGVGVLFGLYAILHPFGAVAGLALVFGAFAFIDGALNIVAALRQREHGGPWGGLLAAGALAIAAGSLTIWYPLVTATFLVYVIAAYAIITGVGQVVAAVRLRREIRGEWLLILAGVLSVLFGLAVLVAPLAGAVVIATWIGVYALFTGVLLLVLAFRLRGAARGGSPALAASR